MDTYNVDWEDIQARQFPCERRKWLRGTVDMDVYIHNYIIQR